MRSYRYRRSRSPLPVCRRDQRLSADNFRQDKKNVRGEGHLARSNVRYDE